MHRAWFRMYEELNDFLPPERRKVSFLYRFNGAPSVKDAIEAVGVPHVEVDLILVNGRSVDFGYHLRDGDRVSVYPVFESFDIADVTRLRPEPLREPRFILDVHLGTLARRLRLLGFDTLYRNDYDDHEIAAVAARERRIILTRDTGLLKHGNVTHGYLVRSKRTREQVKEVIARFDLGRRLNPFTRCTVCNAPTRPVMPDDPLEDVPPRSREEYDGFRRCTGCGRVYWKGTHYERMAGWIDSLKTGDGA